VTRVTGERVSTPVGGFNPTYQRHVAAYARCAELLPPGRVLDLGAGTGHSAALLAPRESVAVDLDPDALSGQDRETVVADMRALPFPDQSFASVLAVQSIEHVPDPERAVAEIARVLKRPGGVAILVTPNRLTFGRPDEVIDPYHYVEFDARDLRELCAPAFTSLEILGLFGSERYREISSREHRRLDALLARDPLRLRRLVPRGLRQRLYDALLRRARRDADPLAASITPEDFTLANAPLDECLDLVAVCRA
jgi:SAM-dependent methyltransferase